MGGGHKIIQGLSLTWTVASESTGSRVLRVVQLFAYLIPCHLRKSNLRAVLPLGRTEIHSWAAVVGTEGKSLPPQAAGLCAHA